MHVRIARLDLASMDVDPDAGGSLTSGYDPDFREAVRVPDGTQAGRSARAEMPLITIPAQIEDQDWKSLTMEPTGNDPTTTIVLVFHFRDLERLGLVDATTGNATCPIVGDRLDSILNPRTEQVEQKAPDPGVYCTQAIPRSYGLGAQRRNLLVCTFAERGKARR